jgi:hypothetical protein
MPTYRTVFFKILMRGAMLVRIQRGIRSHWKFLINSGTAAESNAQHRQADADAFCLPRGAPETFVTITYQSTSIGIGTQCGENGRGS